MASPLVALTTDFGAGSAYVAQVKAVLYSALPAVRIVDVSHDLPAHSVRHAEVLLRAVAFAFPLGTVHVIIVDPGVGTSRRGLAVTARGMTFVGPDNGVLGGPIGASGARTVVLDKPELFRRPVAPTFHGRDVFAPIAAELAGGLALEAVGTSISDALPSTLPPPAITPRRVVGETLAADRFGNLLTNVPASSVGEGWRIAVADREAVRVQTYGEAARGQVVALAGSDGYLEVALREAAAATLFGAEQGLRVVCERQ